MSYTLGMTGRINVADFRGFIDPAQWRDDLPKGLGGASAHPRGLTNVLRGLDS